MQKQEKRMVLLLHLLLFIDGNLWLQVTHPCIFNDCPRSAKEMQLIVKSADHESDPVTMNREMS